MLSFATNKRAKFDYEILETFEAGIVLAGHEVKAVRSGNVSLKGAFVTVRNDELWLTNAYIGKYKYAGSIPDYGPERSRKLLMHKKEIMRLMGKRKTEGLTLLPLSLYTAHNRIKVKICLGRGKKKYEKRETIKKRDVGRTMREALKRARPQSR